jgi:hypothetical protein
MGKGIAPHVGQVLTKQISCPTGITGHRRSHDLHMMAFPVHLSADGSADIASCQSVEIGDGQPEGRVGVNGEPKGQGGRATVQGALGPPIPRGRVPICRDRTTVVLGGRSEASRSGGMTRLATVGALHGPQIEPVA